MIIEQPPVGKDLDLNEWLYKLWRKLQDDHLYGSATWNAGSIGDGNEEAKEVTVNGAELGDFAEASLSVDISDLVLDAQVTADDTVTCVLANNTGDAVDLASATVYVRVMKKTS